MKKLIVLAAAALLAAGANAAYKDGTYTGVGQGKAGPVKVQVTVKGGKVAAVKVLEQKETPMIFKGAESGVVPAIVKANGTKGVATVSGATLSSKGILAGADAALKQAK
ncbi:FMN-binding protein [Mesosutterella sp. AGMB02718]|uniref:FMN-binding protein n=1 Tax=Mesosutterella faecium TaxID=2925194 RepID=A0ABT7IMH0_9BURK|nr:FMN-binding protein [Mesosutterella sp. AGMB02718]MDL2059116.1 FMN-binding protein [Mesosutterella sp. AGMB02718]